MSLVMSGAVSIVRRVSEISRSTVERVASEMFQADRPDVVLLLGAGASRKSGISTADEIAEWACRWAYCREHDRNENDPQVMRSDWWAWMNRKPWFAPHEPLASQYPQIIAELVQPREARRQFFLDIVNRRVDPSVGYEALADLVADGWLKTILTVNFDPLIFEVLSRRTRPRHVDLIRVPSDAHVLSTMPSAPQVVHLHGMVEYYADQNLEEETQNIAPALRQAVMPLVRDHPLVVVGYRGAEASVMHDLLRDGADESHNFRHGIYWCVHSPDMSELHPYIHELSYKIGKNLQIVPIDGFDECMQAWAAASKEHTPNRPIQAALPSVPDLEPVPEATLHSLDWASIGVNVPAYADRTGIAVPSSVSRSWLVKRMKSGDLIATHDGRLVPTRAGELLFATTVVTQVEVTTPGGTTMIEGNVFEVVEDVREALDSENRAFTLKGETSEIVRPYPPLALKELLVNALAHRDHSVSEPVLIEANEDELRFDSPGGVVASVDPARLGKRGVKGYRNPVIADFLYGTGIMEKEGSGLADAMALAAEIGGSVSVATDEANSRFIAVIRPRPERPDAVTNTAHAALGQQRFMTNVVPVSIGTARVFVGTTDVTGYRALHNRHAGIHLPPFSLREGRIVTFADLRDSWNPLSEDVVGDVEDFSIDDYFGDPDRERALVQLLNESLQAHAQNLGLIVLPRDQRIYFPSEDGTAREVSYKARVRRAKRTVTKPALSRTTGAVRYWEHEAVGYRFRRFEDEWGLMLVPGWLFTHDGERRLLKGPRVGPLSTRRASRDYNPQVANDLVFWVAVLTEGKTNWALNDGIGFVELANQLVSAEISNAPAAPGAGEVASADDEEIDELEDELALIAASDSEEDA